jgi:putative endonuclease
MYYVYLLQSEKTKKFYIGFTSDLKQRLKKHNTGKVQSTKAFIPYKLIYFKDFAVRKML